MLKFFLSLILLLLIISCEKDPHFSSNQQSEFKTFQPIDISNQNPNKSEIIYLHDNKTQIYELANGEIYIKRVDPVTNKEFMIKLDDLQTTMKFSDDNSQNTAVSTASDVEKNFSVLEWTPLIGKKAYPHKRRGHSSVVLDNIIVYFGGCHLDFECYNDLYFFNLEYILY